MLLNFALENWKSFCDKKDFTMLASDAKTYGQRVSKASKLPARILPAAAMFGGNASGKSGFVSALAFAKKFIVVGTEPDAPIPVQPFLLDDAASAKPTELSFSVLVDGDAVYEFSFAVTRERVVRESLVRVLFDSKWDIYRRDEKGISIPHNVDAESKGHLAMCAQCARPNQLFLTTAVGLNAAALMPVYRWFKDTLTVVELGQPAALAAYGDEDVLKAVNEEIACFDLGIERLQTEEVLRPSTDARIFGELTGQCGAPEYSGEFVAVDKAGRRKTLRLVSYHAKAGGEPVRFELKHEASGVRQAVGLLPLLLRPQSKVYVVDDFDSHLHPHLARTLLDAFLSGRSQKTRSQLLFTARDVQLMDANLLRLDEIWLAERDAEGVTDLLCLADFKDVRKGEDVRKSYLQGRFGGVPRVLTGGLTLRQAA